MVAGARHLFDRVANFPGREELALLDVDRGSRAPRFHQQVRLAREERRNLDDVAHFGGGRYLARVVYVREHGHTDFGLDARKDFEASRQSRPAVGAERGAVGLVVGGFEDVRNLERAGGGREAPGHPQGVPLTLDHAGPGDQEQRASRGQRELANVDKAAHEIEAVPKNSKDQMENEKLKGKNSSCRTRARRLALGILTAFRCTGILSGFLLFNFEFSVFGFAF